MRHRSRARWLVAALALGCAGCPKRGPVPSESFAIDEGFDPEAHRWRGLVAEGDTIYFGTLRSVATNGGALRTVSEDPRCSGRSTIAKTPRWTYWSCQDGGAPLGKLMRLRPGAPPEAILPRYFSGAAMAGDAGGLWIAGSIGQLPSGAAERSGIFRLADDDDAKPELVAKEDGAAVENARITTDAETVFWIRYGTFAKVEPAIMATSKKDGATRVLATQAGTYPTAIAVSGTDVYFGGKVGDSQGLARVPKAGGPVTLVAGPKASGEARRITRITDYEGLVFGTRYAYWVTGCSGHFLKGVPCEASGAGRADLTTGAVDLLSSPHDIAGPVKTGGFVYWAEQPRAGERWTLHRVREE